MPGEERKFNRRSIVAFIPTCKREREPAASHTSILDGMATLGVAVNSITGVTDKERRGVAVIAEVLVGAIFVCVEEDIGIAVAGVVMDGKVSCGDDVGFNAAVDRREGKAVGGGVFVLVADDDIEFAASVGLMDVKVACGDDIVEVGVGAESIVHVEREGVRVSDLDRGMAD